MYAMSFSILILLLEGIFDHWWILFLTFCVYLESIVVNNANAQFVARVVVNLQKLQWYVILVRIKLIQWMLLLILLDVAGEPWAIDNIPKDI